MTFFSQEPFDSYLIDEGEGDDSSECQSSSEDEIDVLLNGSITQRKKLKLLRNIRENTSSHGQGKELSSSEDEFEKEMNAELNQHISHLEQERVSTQGEADLPISRQRQIVDATKSNERKDTYYNDVYFDSDEEDDAGRKSQHAVLSNDDLLYDPTMDDRDQIWVDRQRRKHGTIPKSKCQSHSGKGKKVTPKPTSDALLDCPACLTTVCIDCQRHETYKNQYRAMFVMNCIIDNSEKLQCPEQPSKKKKKGQQDTNTNSSLLSAESSTSSSDLFNPVKCSECNTVVAVIDKDEVYHFFNVLASHT